MRSSTIFMKFLSTPSARRATLFEEAALLDQSISIHALREEGDDCVSQQLIRRGQFLSTPSARRATKPHFAIASPFIISIHALREEGDPALRQTVVTDPRISIHALREEGDRPFSQFVMTLGYFYPRPPRGGRRTLALGNLAVHIFLSTPSARRATQPCR